MDETHRQEDKGVKAERRAVCKGAEARSEAILTLALDRQTDRKRECIAEDLRIPPRPARSLPNFANSHLPSSFPPSAFLFSCPIHRVVSGVMVMA